MIISRLTGKELADRLEEALPNVVEGWDPIAIWVKPDHMVQVAHFLFSDPSLDFNYLNSISAVDFIEYFEIVYLNRRITLTFSSSRLICLLIVWWF